MEAERERENGGREGRGNTREIGKTQIPERLYAKF